MIKKLLLLAGMALMAIAFGAPASASALEWTDEGAPFEGTAEDTLSGSLAFGNPEPGQTKFGCVLHIGLKMTGGSTTGSIASIAPTTETCQGEGLYSGCSLVGDSATVPVTNAIHIVETNKVTVTTVTGEPIVIHYAYNAACPVEKTSLTVGELIFETTNSDLTDLTVTAGGTMHAWIRNLGEITTSVALFGTLGTETGTVSIS